MPAPSLLYENTFRIAAIERMSFLDSQHSGDLGSSIKIEHYQIEKEMHLSNLDVCPKVYWYNAECPQDQRQRILVE